METTSVFQKPTKNKRKLNEEEDIDGNSKSLENLPEDILRHILSFLPTRDAVRTSVLSKVWEYLWASTPNLDFDMYSLAKRKRKRKLFMNFVERVLYLRDSSVLQRFTLCYDVLQDASRVNSWISVAVRHNVQVLSIKLRNFEDGFSLPYVLFTCKALKSLHLCMPCILNLPTTIWFSNLKILTIKNVTFSDECLTQQFFSGLPVLEKLQLEDCSWGSLKVVRISATNLRFLSVQEFEKRISKYGEGC